MKRILAMLLLAGLVLAVAAGCGGGKEEKAEPAATSAPAAGKAAQVAEQPAAAQQPTAVAKAAPTQPPAEPAPAATEEDTLSVTDRQSWLEGLRSYTARWSMAWTSSDGTKTHSMEWFQEYTTDPAATHMRMTSSESGETEQQTYLELWQIADQAYMVTEEGAGETKCTVFSSDAQSAIGSAMSNLSMIGNVEDAKFVGSETVNGVRTKHYRYDEKGAKFFGATKLTGDVWVAVDGDYAIRESVTWEGDAAFGLSASAEDIGKGTWEWEILEVNPTLTITAPAGCESATAEFPMMPDAAKKAVFGDMMSYESATSLEDVATFYQEQMATAGWTPDGEAEISEQFAMLNFVKDESKAQVLLNADGDKTSVTIMVQK